MVNINIDIPDDLHKQIKLDSIKADKTLKDYVTDSLREEAG